MSRGFLRKKFTRGKLNLPRVRHKRMAPLPQTLQLLPGSRMYSTCNTLGGYQPFSLFTRFGVFRVLHPFRPGSILNMIGVNRKKIPFVLCTVQDNLAFQFLSLHKIQNSYVPFLIIANPIFLLRRSMYGIPLHAPVSLLKTKFLPLGVKTTQSFFVCDGTMYSTLINIGTNNKLAIPCSLSQASNSSHHSLVLVTVVPALQLPVRVVSPSLMLVNKSLTKKEWSVAPPLIYSFHLSKVYL